MNLKDAFLGLDNYFSPKVIGEVNDQYIKVVKIKGKEVPWHNHENEDELFLRLKVRGTRNNKDYVFRIY